jgi:hypothetical protein
LKSSAQKFKQFFIYYLMFVFERLLKIELKNFLTTKLKHRYLYLYSNVDYISGKIAL